MDRWHLATPRLILRQFADTDLGPFMAYRNDPLVARYQGWDGITLPQAQAFLREQQATRPGTPGQGLQIALQRRDTGELIGDCFLQVDAEEPRQAEVGYTVARAHQRRGYAAEAVRGVLAYAFGALRLHRLIAVTDCRNAASVALLERLGWRREGHFLQNVWFKGAWADEYLYALLYEEWRCRQEDGQGQISTVPRSTTGAPSASSDARGPHSLY
jgi:RimJ/RimL family protein N-acetyltransferase